ncbi:MAG TPA: GNAT family N-acetyltransferase [Devosia sp.]|nr:GNAT family N-acetyltransferase [Devosia sp.]
MRLRLTVTATPTDIEFAAVTNALNAFNEADTGVPADNRPLMVIARDEAGDIQAGIYGLTHWGWLYVQKLFVAEAARGQGLAATMLRMAEDEARARGCHGAWIDTFNPVALKVYERAGYVAFGGLEDFPTGRTRTFLKKRL